MLFNIEPLRMWVHKVLPVVYDDSLSYYEVLDKTVRKLNEVIDLTDEQTKFIQEFSDNLTEAINEWEEGLSTEWTNYKKRIDAEWKNYKSNTDEDIEIWKHLKEVEIERTVAEGIYAFAEYFEGLKNQAVDAADKAGDEADRAEAAAGEAAENAVEAVMPTLQGIFDNRYAFKSAIGSPLVASTAAEMTDTNKIYVYVGDETGYVSGNWYYYDGTAWVSGGVYNSVAVVTDTTLSEAGVPADAKAAGDEIGDLKSAISEQYFDKTVTGNTVSFNKTDAKLGVKELIANLPYSADGYTNICLRHINKNLYVKYASNMTIEYTGENIGAFVHLNLRQIIGPIDCRNINTLYMNFHHSGGGYQFTVANYDAEGNYINMIRTNAYIAENQEYTLDVSDAQFIYMSLRDNETYMRISSERENYNIEFNNGESLTIYGGTYNYKSGILTSMYDSEGNELTEPIKYQLEPMEIPTLYDDINEFMNVRGAGLYKWIGEISVTYLTPSAPDLRRDLDSALNEISTLTPEVSTLTTNENLLKQDVVPYPSYFDEQINTNIPTIRMNMKNIGANGITFFYITDSHWNLNSKNSPALIQRIAKTLSIDTILHGGDVFQDSPGTNNYYQGTDTIRQLKRSGKVFVALGNHDFDAKDDANTTVILTANQASGLLQQQESYWMRKYANGYFYADIDGYRTRLIVLNSGDHNHHGTMVGRELDDEQRTFLIDALKVPNGYHIIVLQHIWWANGVVTTFSTAVAEILDNYNASAERTGYVEAIFCGHGHKDINGTTPNGIPIIETTCDRRTDTATQQGTVDEQAFDTVTIDYVNKVIHLVRTGRGSSRTISYASI